MPKKEVREDVRAWLFAAKLYALFVSVIVFAIGSDLRHAAQAIERLYGG